MPEKLLSFWPSQADFKACVNLWIIFCLLISPVPTDVKLSTAAKE